MHEYSLTSIEPYSLEINVTQEQCSHAERDPAQTGHSLRLLPEILSEVFLITLPIDRIEDYQIYITQALRLTHVSQGWRAVGLATAQLWTHLKFSGKKRELQIAQAWLYRSRSCPITFTMVGLLNRNRGLGARQAALRILVPHCARWRDATLSCSLSTDSTTWHLISKISNNVHLLECLAIPFCSTPEVLGIFGTVPKLRSLSIDGDDKLFGNIIPWSQLVDLTLGPIGLRNCFDVLQQSHNLVALSINISNRSKNIMETPMNAPHIQLASLTNLEITGDSASTATLLDHFFDHFTFPSLIHFYYGWEWPVHSKHLALASMLSRSSTKRRLTSLDLDVGLLNGSPGCLSTILRATPHVVNLVISGWDDDEYIGRTVINLLTVMDNNVCILPKLQSFIYNPPYSIGSGTAFTEMIESRRKGGRLGNMGWLRLVRINLDAGALVHELSSIALASLKQFHAEGLIRFDGIDPIAQAITEKCLSDVRVGSTLCTSDD